ncbi:MAG TPA: HAD-IC family P-type ATPase, partial [Cryomorphaceae bacterium]|nr:HAD-IC family P-type ATPase [Cryomorphaceae bacterium]
GPRSESLIKGLETHSSHPIATALVRAFESVEAETFAEVEEVKGEGMKGVTANGESVFIGKATGHADADLVLTVDGQRVAALNISDSLKAGAAQAVEAFNRAGIETIMLSGDRKEKVLRTAKELGIKDAKYSMSPEEKLKHIEKLSETRTVVMVGDGINDGPALSRAQVGVSPGGSTALAMESARVVLMNKNEMQALVDAFKISKHTYLTIKQNLFWAFFYNVVAIPIAAVGLLSPMIAALSMAFSDVIVVGNSLRLRRKKLS